MKAGPEPKLDAFLIQFRTAKQFFGSELKNWTERRLLTPALLAAERPL
tara:strand:+ start:86 stop:229 length:144 start_codon:yes stop_codon:yes gene_type:complete